MKKTITANIGGLVFYVDEDAYDILHGYLKSIKRHYESNIGNEDIINDIEIRIAEILQNKITSSKQVITIEDVNEVINIMGRPEQFENNDAQPQGNQKNKSRSKLYRDGDDKIIAGVCSGISAFFNVDPLWVRIFFVFFLFLFSSGFWIYIILWIIIPKATTTREKLEMKGKSINISNIEASIKEDINDLRDKFSNFKNETKSAVKNNKKQKEGAEKLVNFIFTIFKYFAKSIAVIIGLALVFTGIFLIIGFISSFFHVFNFPLDGTYINYNNLSILSFLKVIFPSEFYIYVAVIGLILLIGLPLFMLVYNGFKLIFGLKFHNKYIGFGSFSLWLIGFVLCVVSTFQVFKSFSHKSLKTERIEVAETRSIFIDVKNDNEAFDFYDNEAIQLKNIRLLGIDNKIFLYGKPEVLLNQKHGIEIFEIILLSSSRGENKETANNNISNIRFNIEINDNEIILPKYFILDQSKWRNQKLKVILNVPKHVSVNLTPAALETLTDSF